jgi:hypothetical protein
MENGESLKKRVKLLYGGRNEYNLNNINNNVDNYDLNTKILVGGKPAIEKVKEKKAKQLKKEGKKQEAEQRIKQYKLMRIKRRKEKELKKKETRYAKKAKSKSKKYGTEYKTELDLLKTKSQSYTEKKKKFDEIETKLDKLRNPDPNTDLGKRLKESMTPELRKLIEGKKAKNGIKGIDGMTDIRQLKITDVEKLKEFLGRKAEGYNKLDKNELLKRSMSNKKEERIKADAAIQLKKLEQNKTRQISQKSFEEYKKLPEDIKKLSLDELKTQHEQLRGKGTLDSTEKKKFDELGKAIDFHQKYSNSSEKTLQQKSNYVKLLDEQKTLIEKNLNMNESKLRELEKIEENGKTLTPEQQNKKRELEESISKSQESINKLDTLINPLKINIIESSKATNKKKEEAGQIYDNMLKKDKSTLEKKQIEDIVKLYGQNSPFTKEILIKQMEKISGATSEKSQTDIRKFVEAELKKPNIDVNLFDKSIVGDKSFFSRKTLATKLASNFKQDKKQELADFKKQNPLEYGKLLSNVSKIDPKSTDGKLKSQELLNKFVKNNPQFRRDLLDANIIKKQSSQLTKKQNMGFVRRTFTGSNTKKAVKAQQFFKGLKTEGKAELTPKEIEYLKKYGAQINVDKLQNINPNLKASITKKVNEFKKNKTLNEKANVIKKTKTHDMNAIDIKQMTQLNPKEQKHVNTIIEKLKTPKVLLDKSMSKIQGQQKQLLETLQKNNPEMYKKILSQKPGLVSKRLGFNAINKLTVNNMSKNKTKKQFFGLEKKAILKAEQFSKYVKPRQNLNKLKTTNDLGTLNPNEKSKLIKSLEVLKKKGQLSQDEIEKLEYLKTSKKLTNRMNKTNVETRSNGQQYLKKSNQKTLNKLGKKVEKSAFANKQKLNTFTPKDFQNMNLKDRKNMIKRLEKRGLSKLSESQKEAVEFLKLSIEAKELGKQILNKPKKRFYGQYEIKNSNQRKINEIEKKMNDSKFKQKYKEKQELRSKLNNGNVLSLNKMNKLVTYSNPLSKKNSANLRKKNTNIQKQAEQEKKAQTKKYREQVKLSANLNKEKVLSLNNVNKLVSSSKTLSSEESKKLRNQNIKSQKEIQQKKEENKKTISGYMKQLKKGNNDILSVNAIGKIANSSKVIEPNLNIKSLLSSKSQGYSKKQVEQKEQELQKQTNNIFKKLEKYETKKNTVDEQKIENLEQIKKNIESSKEITKDFKSSILDKIDTKLQEFGYLQM